MIGKLRPHVTYANVMVTVLLFVVLGGTAWALARNSVGSKELKSNAVKEVDIANDAVTGPKVEDGSLDDDDFEAGALPPGPQGPPGERGLPGEPGQPGAPGKDASTFFASIREPGGANPAVIDYGRGVTAVNDLAGDSGYEVTFASSVTNCVVHAVPGIGDPATGTLFTVSSHPVVNMSFASGAQVAIEFRDAADAVKDTGFMVMAFC